MPPLIPKSISSQKMNGKVHNQDSYASNLSSTAKTNSSLFSLEEFASYVPVRLDERERVLLTVLESALNVSEYTDNVDVSIRRGNKARRILDGILEACNIATGLAVCGMQDEQECHDNNVGEHRDIKDGFELHQSNKKKKKKKKSKKKVQNVYSSDDIVTSNDQNDNDTTHARSLASRDTKENKKFFQDIFEIGRRNKVLNPSKMRGTYGKLMHLLQDAQSPTVARSLGFTLHKELMMVKPFLKLKMGALGMKLLSDPRLEVATAHIIIRDPATGNKVPREKLEKQVKQKQKLKETLVQEYLELTQKGDEHQIETNATDCITKEDLYRAIESISDAISVVEHNLAPVRRTLQLLEDNFDPQNPEKPFSLQLSSSFSSSSSSSYTRFGLSAFSSGGSSSGATLSHSHPTQYTFVWQSLKLWCEVQKNMHKLWVCADDDLLSTQSGYSLWNTGQGLNRVQSCPKVGKVMRLLLAKTQRAAGAQWVGLSVIHLGDRDVPNALVFIDKYTQIPRFLMPLVDFVDGIHDMCNSNDGFKKYVYRQFGTERKLKMTVLSDYFRHGFDGSGDDGGSCIDGRLTSSWNWTSKVAKKRYYHALMLSGFQGFDGDFK